MTYIMVDVEADGPIPGDYSMICFGAVVVASELKRTFFGRLRPISENWIPKALEVSGFSRAETETFEDPKQVMVRFAEWINQESTGHASFVSDNNGFDWQFINWYFHHFTGSNPFGFSSTNLGSLYKGAMRDMSKSFKHLRQTKHSHNPIDDAMGNAEAFLAMIREFDLRITL